MKMEISGMAKEEILLYERCNYHNKKLKGARVFQIDGDSMDLFAEAAQGINHSIKGMIQDTKYNLLMVSSEGALVLYSFSNQEKKIVDRVDFNKIYQNTYKVAQKIISGYKEPIPQPTRRL